MIDYTFHFNHLNVNKNGNQYAPHKAILLLSVIDMIESGDIPSPFIPISDGLVVKFKQNWVKYVSLPRNYNNELYYPFYHLSSSPFWHLIKSHEFENKAPTSMKALKRNFQGAVIDVALYDEILNPLKREALRNVLISTYLPDSQSIAAEPMLSALAVISMFEWLVLNA